MAQIRRTFTEVQKAQGPDSKKIVKDDWALNQIQNLYRIEY
jgi:hypothetical protein